tara:strand:+ start:56 stop:940 length:885 start_codon:yes stop_codon:yes gene_type:complete
MTNQENNLDNALDMFINAMRLFISTELMREHGDDWERKYFETLYDQQKKIWGDNRLDVQNLSALIDFGNLYPFAIKTRFFHQFVNRGAGNFPSKFNDINQARNMRAHYLDFDQDTSDLAYAQMVYIAKNLDMDELENDIRQLKDDSFKELNTGNESSISTTNDKHNNPETRQRPKIRKVINVILNTIEVAVDKSYTNLSTINSTGLYSVEPNFKRKDNDWYLLLINTEKRTIYVFIIPSNDNVYSKLDKRVDKNVYRLTFDIDDLTFKDKSSQQKFDIYLEGKCKYDNDSLIFS